MPTGLGALCRMDDDWVGRIARCERLGPIVATSAALILVGTIVYGAVFGLWRSPEQALYAAAKMPLFFALLVLFSSVISVLLAQVLGARLAVVQVALCVAISLAVTAAILLALAPVALLFVLQAPPRDSPQALAAYRGLLIGHTAVIAVAGVLGNLRLYSLLRRLTGSAGTARRVLAGWLLVTGLTGSELSWVLSPFLARPDLPVPVLNPNAFTSNFFEYLWQAARGLAG